MYSKNAFTLVELIVGVTISMLLMTSVGILVSSGMQNILKQQNIMSKNSLLTKTLSEFYNGFNNISTQTGYIFSSNSGAIFKIDQKMQKGGFGYLGVSTQSGVYCSSDSEIGDMDYLTWKTFIPYEEIGEDIFTDFSQIETQTVNSGALTYTVDTLNHQILENGITLIGGNVFGHEIKNGENGLLTRLNNPTAIALAEGGFFLSDTLNHRILFYKDNNIYLILDQSDGLQEPTGLAYDDIKNVLYISNSGKGEILRLSSEVLISNPELNISFSPTIDINSISRINIEFPEFSGNVDPINASNFTFNNINNGSGFIQTVGNTIEYYFTDYRNISQPITNGTIIGCTPSDIYSLNGTTPERNIITCSDTNTGTHQIHTGDIYENFNDTDVYNITVQNISPIFAQAKHHLVNIELFNDTNSRYTDTFGYFTQGDGIVNNLQFSSLTTLVSGLKYPTGLNINGNNLEVNDFISRKQYSYDLNNTSSYTQSNLGDFTSNNLENIPNNISNDILLENPVSLVNINYDISEKFLSAKIKYYQYFNCYNPEEQVQKSFILQKNID